jgi:broad specificity phosphatase PhoE
MLRRRGFVALIAAALLSSCVHALPADLTVFLVRHAEKEKGDDPGLTAVGEARAMALASTLGRKRITAIYSTDTKRTRATAAPIAEKLGVGVEIYDAKALSIFAQMLKRERGVVLVVGHSNTTPELVTLLGGEAGKPIDEATEFDRLYRLDMEGDVVTTRVSTYGPE